MELYINFPTVRVPEIFVTRKCMMLPLILDQIRKTHINDYEYLFDCYSMTTIECRTDSYYLAKNAGIPFVKPIALSGQVGTEVAQCLAFLSRDDFFKHAICVASQSAKSINNINIGGYSAAAASMIISRSRLEGISTYKVLYCQIVRSSEEIESLIKRIIEICVKIDWIIVQNDFDVDCKIIKVLASIGPIYNRSKYKRCNFGCADVFVTLEDMRNNDKELTEGKGLIVITGRYGEIALMVLEWLT